MRYHITFVYRTRNLVLYLSLPGLKVLSLVSYILGPWTFPLPKLSASVHVGPYSKVSTTPSTLFFQSMYMVFESHQTPIYTDGSKTDGGVP